MLTNKKTPVEHRVLMLRQVCIEGDESNVETLELLLSAAAEQYHLAEKLI